MIKMIREIFGKAGIKLIEVDGVGTVEEVTERIETVLKDWGKI